MLMGVKYKVPDLFFSRHTSAFLTPDFALLPLPCFFISTGFFVGWLPAQRPSKMPVYLSYRSA